MRFTVPFAADDPVTTFFKTWSGHAAGWMPYLIIIAAVLGFVLYTIGHNRGWAHMREALAGGVLVMVIIALAPTLF
jgi:hypothetical protein